MNKKDSFFDEFALLIEKVKSKEEYKLEDVEKYYIDINKFDNLTYQDVITYMLYCFQFVELTGKWKLKKLINYSIFIDKMEMIYDEIFCETNLKINNKIIAVTSFGNIIENTINYDIEENIESTLTKYLYCINKNKNYIKDDTLILLRGNLYCQIYNTVLKNIEINSQYETYLNQLKQTFDYEKYYSMALELFDEILKEEKIEYTDLTNLLLFKTYNNIEIKEEELTTIFKYLGKYYKMNFFDKKVFMFLLSNFVKLKIDNNLKIEFSFEEAKDSNNTIIINQNEIDCNLKNNIDLFKKCINKCLKIKLVDEDDFYKLLLAKDKIILQYQTVVNSVINSDSYISFITEKIFIEFLKLIDLFDEYFDKKINKINKEKKNINYDIPFNNRYLTNNEIFEKVYTKEDIKKHLETEPILKLEYNSNGTYKTISEIIKEKIDASTFGEKDLKKIELLNKIISIRNGDISSLLRDYYSLLQIETDETNIICEKENILKKVLPDLIELKLILSGNLSKEQKDELFDEYINPCVKKIAQSRVNNKKFDNTKEFLNHEKSNSDNYFGICKLQDIIQKYSNE